MEFSNETALLQEIYQGAVMGSESIRLLLPKVKHTGLRTDLKSQYEGYQTTAEAADAALRSLGKCPRELSQSQQAMLWMGVQGKTLMNQETSHLAKMLIQGSNMGILSLTGVLNSFQKGQKPGETGQEASPAAALARDTLKMEQKNISRLKQYLN